MKFFIMEKIKTHDTSGADGMLKEVHNIRQSDFWGFKDSPLLYLIILIFLFLYCEVKIEWKLEYEPAGPGSYKINSLDGLENFYATGSYMRENQNPVGIVAKYSPQGELKWFRLYENKNFRTSEGQQILTTKKYFLKNGETVYLLVSLIDLDNNYQLRLLKYDSLGNTEWETVVQKSSSEISAVISQDYTGNICIAGWERNRRGGSNTIFFNKYSSSGAHILVKKYSLEIFYIGNLKFAITKSGGLIAGGVCQDCYDFFFICFDSLGRLEQTIIHKNSSAESILSDLKIDELGNIYLTGVSLNKKADTDWLTIVYDKSYHLLWSQIYDSEEHNNDTPQAIIIDESLNVYITGITENKSGLNSILTLKYDRNGNLIWTRKFSGDKDKFITPYFFDTNFFDLRKENLIDFLYITGLMDNKIFLMQYDRDGNLFQCWQYNLRGMENKLQARIGPLIAFQGKKVNQNKTYLVKLGRFRVLGIGRWD